MQHIQPLYNSQKHFVLKWQEDKDKALGRKSLWDDLMKQEKKDKKQAPNAYFKSEKKSDLLRTDRMVQSLIMSEKRTFGRISKSPKISQIDELMKVEKKKIGPNHYKNTAAGVKMGQDQTGQYRGLSKTTTDQLMLVQHQKATALDKPQVGHYSPNLRLTENRVYVANLNRDKGPQRAPLVKKEKSPGPATYQTEKKDERNLLSIRKKSITYSIGSPDRKANPKCIRFIDDVQKKNQWKPAFTKYNFTAEQKAKMISPGPRLAHKK